MKNPHHILESRIEPLEGRIAPSVVFPSVVSIDRTTPATEGTGASSVTYTVTFSEAVTGVDADDFEVVTTGDAKATGSVDVASLTTSTFSVTVNGLQGNGTVQLNLVDNDTIIGTSEPLGGTGTSNGSFSGETYRLLQTMPEVASITADGANPTGSTTVSWTVTFSELVDGVDATDFSLVFTGMTSATLGTVTPISPSGGFATSYTVTATSVSGVGTVGLNLADDETIRDVDNNPLQTNPISFAAPQTSGTGPGARAIASGDVNGDGRPDVVVVNSYGYQSGGNTVSVLLGNGDGSFQTKVDYATSNNPRSVVIADVNGDGNPDIAVTGSLFDYQSSTFPFVSVLLGNGDGTFQPRQNFGDSFNSPLAVTVGDMNNDGNPDLVVTTDSGSGFVNVLLGNGNGTFQLQQTFVTGRRPVDVEVADVNGDGNPDVITANRYDQTVSVLLGNGTGSLGAATAFDTNSEPSAVAVGDVNGDGNLDLVAAGYYYYYDEGEEEVYRNGRISVLLGNGAGSFGAPSTRDVGLRLSDVQLADFDGDGDLDIAVTDISQQPAAPPENGGIVGTPVYVLPGMGDGTFGAELPFQTTATNNDELTIADFDGDGKADIGTANGDSNTADALLNNGAGPFTGETFTIIAPELDLAINDVTHTGSGFTAGQAVTFMINYANLGSVDATGVQIEVFLPTQAFFVGSENPDWNRSGDLLTRTIGALNASASGSVSLILHVDEVVNSFSSTFDVTATILDDGANGSEITLKNNSDIDFVFFIPTVYNGFVLTAPGIAPKNKFAPPVIRVFDRVSGEELYTFSAYEDSYRDSIRVALGDFNFDGIDDIVTTTQHNGGRMRFFDGSNGQQFFDGALSEEVPVFGTSRNKGAFVAVGNTNGFGFPEIVVGSSLISRKIGGGTVKVYSLDSDSQPEALPEAIGPIPQVLEVIREFQPFGAGFKGGVRVAVGDVDFFGNFPDKALPEQGNGKSFLEDDIVVGQGLKGNRVKVYKGATEELLGEFRVGGNAFKGGVSVGLGDVNDDGHEDIIVGRNTGKPSVVQVFDGRSLLPTSGPNQIGENILPFDSSYRFGVRVATADVNGDGVADIITSVGIKNQSVVKFFLSTFQSGSSEVQFIEDPDRTITAYSQFPNVALWVAGSGFDSRR